MTIVTGITSSSHLNNTKVETNLVSEFYEIDKTFQEIIKTKHSFNISIFRPQYEKRIGCYGTITFFDTNFQELTMLLMITPAQQIANYYKEAKINVDNIQVHELRLDVPITTLVKNALLAEKRFHRESQKLKKYLISIGKLTATNSQQATKKPL